MLLVSHVFIVFLLLSDSLRRISLTHVVKRQQVANGRVVKKALPAKYKRLNADIRALWNDMDSGNDIAHLSRKAGSYVSSVPKKIGRRGRRNAQRWHSTQKNYYFQVIKFESFIDFEKISIFSCIKCAALGSKIYFIICHRCSLCVCEYFIICRPLFIIVCAWRGKIMQHCHIAVQLCY